GPSQPRADPGDPRVVLHGPVAVGRLRAHRPELENGEARRAPPYAFLPVERGTPVAEQVGERDGGGDDRQHAEADQASDDVADPLDAGIASAVHLADVEHERYPFELGE